MPARYVRSQHKNRSQRQWVWITLLVFLCLSMAVLSWLFIIPRQVKEPLPVILQNPPRMLLYQVLENRLDEAGAHRIRKIHNHQDLPVWIVDIPDDTPIPAVHLGIKAALKDVDGQVIASNSEPVSGRLSLQLGWLDSAFIKIVLVPKAGLKREAGKIALVIDDCGDRWDSTTKGFLELGGDVTLSILPGRKMSERVAKEISSHGFEVILHLPMEPESGGLPDDGYALMTHMDEEDIENLLIRSLRSVPNAVGVNNHMGSKATADERLMKDLMLAIKKRDLYFLDSRTTARSEALAAAQSVGLLSAKRDVFIDNVKNSVLIRNQLLELVQIARAKGYAIAIGHCHATTLSVLREEIPKLQSQGFKFVRLSQLVF